MNTRTRKATKTALQENKSWARTGCKGHSKKVARKARRRVGKAICKDLNYRAGHDNE